ncbi:hypothetical protein [Buchananella felis]|uniref:hypothetical protein n=1 Tax=Buchananella felis TaxID=3231492 RepID=UPI003527A034
MPATARVQQVSFRAAPALLAHLLPRRGVIVIGGASGSGKSTLARALLDLLPPHAVHLQVEASYLGWRGLEPGLRLVEAALRRSTSHGHADLPTWDWLASRPGGSVPLLAPARLRAPLLIEGVGADVALARLADLVVRVEAPASLRERRVAERDGYWNQLWPRWAADEEAHAYRAGLARALGGGRATPASAATAPPGGAIHNGCRDDVDHRPAPKSRRYLRVVP